MGRRYDALKEKYDPAGVFPSLREAFESLRKIGL
jgi:hypothetical protein